MSVGEPHNVTFYVQHLLGIGHLRRIWFLTRALAERGIPVDLISGGKPVSGLSHPDITLHQLPPVRSLDGHFDRLVDDKDVPIDEHWKNQRRDLLLDIYEKIKPRILITETFPFGRRMMRFELLPLLQAAKQSSDTRLIVSSIRDILQPKSKAGRNEEVLQWLNMFYDYVLVHGDVKVAGLKLTFPFADNIHDKLHYTGYLTDNALTEPDSVDGKGEVIISGGGGAASLKLLQTAIAAKPLSKLKAQTWRVLAGFNLAEAEFVALQQSAPAGLIVERNRADFPGLLRHCTVSVSQAGYNTVMDILRQQTRAVLVPYAEADEVEQSLRASELENHKRVIKLDEDQLSAESLAIAIDHAANLPLPNLDFNLDGAAQSAELIAGWLNA